MCLSTLDTTVILLKSAFFVSFTELTLWKKKKKIDDKQYIKYNCYEKIKQSKAVFITQQ